MGIIKTIKRGYWKTRLYFFDLDLADEEGHIGYAIMDIKDPKEAKKARNRIQDAIDKERNYYVKKIRQNS